MSAMPATRFEPETVPATMLAWQVESAGDPPDSLGLAELAVPVPGEGQVLVEVWSAGLGLADVEAIRRYAAGAPGLVPGQEMCGEVVGVGPGVSRARLGERVLGVTCSPHGSLAKFALARATDVLAAPLHLDDAAASVFHLAYQVGWMGLYRRAAVRVGETLVVHGAAGGLGSAAVQLGRAAGARVIAVVGSPEKVAVAKGLGAELVIDRSTTDVVAAVLEATGGAGAEVVYDPVGGPALVQSVRLAAFEGRVVLAGSAAADLTPPAVEPMRGGNVTLFGLEWRTYLDAKPEIVARAHADLTSLVEVGALRPLISAKLDFEDAPQGLATLAEGESTGRIAVTPP